MILKQIDQHASELTEKVKFHLEPFMTHLQTVTINGYRFLDDLNSVLTFQPNTELVVVNTFYRLFDLGSIYYLIITITKLSNLIGFQLP